MKIVLASASPRRKEILTAMGFSFSVLAADIDEYTDKTAPHEAVMDTALRKAEAVKDMAQGIVVAADTVVAIDGKMLGKPESKEDAEKMLLELSGRRHGVYTGVAVIGGGLTEVFFEKTDVFFRSLSPQEIADYVATGEPMDKAGAYGIQGRGGLFVRKIDGDYFNVVGLPVYRLYSVICEKFLTKGESIWETFSEVNSL